MKLQPVSSSSRKTKVGTRLDTSKELATTIRQRIANRLGRRVRNLAVEVDRGVIRLAGECSTYYSKQLALHATMGVVEDEKVENRIEVCTMSVMSSN